LPNTINDWQSLPAGIGKAAMQTTWMIRGFSPFGLGLAHPFSAPDFEPGFT
jgi:hypothetical protein